MYIYSNIKYGMLKSKHRNKEKQLTSHHQTSGDKKKSAPDITRLTGSSQAAQNLQGQANLMQPRPPEIWWPHQLR